MNKLKHGIKIFIIGLVYISLFFLLGTISYSFLPQGVVVILFCIAGVGLPMLIHHKLKIHFNGLSIFILIILNPFLVIMISPKAYHYYQYRSHEVIHLEKFSDIDRYAKDDVWAIQFENNISINENLITCEAIRTRNSTGRNVSYQCIAPINEDGDFNQIIRFIAVDSHLKISNERIETSDYTQSKRAKLWKSPKLRGGLVLKNSKSSKNYYPLVKKLKEKSLNLSENYYQIELYEYIYEALSLKKKFLRTTLVIVLISSLITSIFEMIFFEQKTKSKI